MGKRRAISWERGLTPVSLHWVTTILPRWSIWLWKTSLCESKNFWKDSTELPISVSVKSSIVKLESCSLDFRSTCTTTHYTTVTVWRFVWFLKKNNRKACVRVARLGGIGLGRGSCEQRSKGPKLTRQKKNKLNLQTTRTILLARASASYRASLIKEIRWANDISGCL